MNTQDWQHIHECSSQWALDVAAGVLRSQGIAVFVQRDQPIAGLDEGGSLYVHPDQAQQAEQILNAQQISDEELTALAMAKP